MVGGLGLTISNYLAEILAPFNKKNKGILVSSEKDFGSTFSFLVLNHSKIGSENIDENLLIDDKFTTYTQFKQTHQFKPHSFKEITLYENKNTFQQLIKNSNSAEKFEKKSFDFFELFSKDNIAHSNKNLTTLSPNISVQEIPNLKLSNFNSKMNESFTSLKANMVQNEDISENIFPKIYNYFANKPCNCDDVLIVDDTDFNIITLKILFEKCNITIEGAVSGDAAIDLCKRKLENSCCKSYKLVLMDIDMPIKNGYQTTIEMKRFFDENEINTPIIACSAFTEAEMIDNCYEVGMVDYMSKPVNLAAIKIMISKHLSGVLK